MAIDLVMMPLDVVFEKIQMWTQEFMKTYSKLYNNTNYLAEESLLIYKMSTIM